LCSIINVEIIFSSVASNNDILDGGPGDDRLYGDQGNDTLSGGQGGYYFRSGSGEDRITNFNIADGDHEFGGCEIKWFRYLIKVHEINPKSPIVD
jgi:Ca2+-binding RTX toxin-like protein